MVHLYRSAERARSSNQSTSYYGIQRRALCNEVIRIRGQRAVLELLVMGGGATPAGVPSFVRKWRTRQDSNAQFVL
ncbi:hypothetical protein EHI43_27240 [Rhizobium leguminosarum]|nr:hypothetical protein EHI43_27240 [Rhizobium leguminosarum]